MDESDDQFYYEAAESPTHAIGEGLILLARIANALELLDGRVAGFLDENAP